MAKEKLFNTEKKKKQDFFILPSHKFISHKNTLYKNGPIISGSDSVGLRYRKSKRNMMTQEWNANDFGRYKECLTLCS